MTACARLHLLLKMQISTIGLWHRPLGIIWRKRRYMKMKSMVEREDITAELYPLACSQDQDLDGTRLIDPNGAVTSFLNC